MFRKRIGLLLRRHSYAIGLVVLACGAHTTADATCPEDLPSACPSTAPSYKAEVANVIATRCASCHSAGGKDSVRTFADYASIYASRGPILDQLYACNMPPHGTASPTAAERAALLTWLVCGAPDN